MVGYAAESERLWLEPLNVDVHLADYHDFMNPYTKTIAESREYMLARLPSPEKPWIENYAILLRPASPLPANEKPKMIGAIGMIRFEAGHGAEVGYGIHRDYQGRGFATEALKAFVRLYFSREREGDWNTLVAAIDPENGASIKVVKKMGFKEGDLQEQEYELSNLDGTLKKVRHREWLLEKPL